MEEKPTLQQGERSADINASVTLGLTECEGSEKESPDSSHHKSALPEQTLHRDPYSVRQLPISTFLIGTHHKDV